MKRSEHPRISRSAATTRAALCAGILGLGLATTAWAVDTDGDSLDDAWEQSHFGNLDRDGSGDFDSNGVSDLLEYQASVDPTLVIPGFLSTERWDNVPNQPLADVLQSAAVREGSPVKSFIGQVDLPQSNPDCDSFLVRWRGTLTAPETGDYRFYLASDYQSQL